MKILKQLLVLVVLGGLGAGGYWWYQTQAATQPAGGGGGESRRSRVVNVEVVPAEIRALDVAVEAVGTTRALRSVDIVPLAEGRIVEIDVTPGAEVGEGAVLARLDDEIEQAGLAEAFARAEEKRLAMERAATLRQSNTISQANLEQLRAELAIAEAAVDRARRRLEDRTIRAPFPGVLGITSINLGARVETSTVLTTLDDLSEVEIEFRLPETVYGRIREDQRVTATTAAFPGRTFAGRVAAVDSRVDQTSRSFRVRARLPNDDRALPVGMFMRLDLKLDTRDGVVVPEEALVVEGGGSFLFVAVDGKAVRRAITTGVRRGGVVEIVGGVASDESVIVRGVQSLRDGIAIAVVGDPPPAAAPHVGATVPETAATDRPRPRS